tara:strand:+ start:75 stop:2483 length:2409 start_codon:yes stop_codon:yes gene_type:complete
MSLFKNKNSIKKTDNAKVRILPVANSLDPKTNKLEYVVSIESNMAELINEGINEIEIATELQPVTNHLDKSVENVSAIIKKDTETSSNSRSSKIRSLDPKMMVSHGDLARSNSEKIKDEIERETITFEEKKILNLPKVDVELDNILQNRVAWNSLSPIIQEKTVLVSGVFKNNNSYVSRNIISPRIKKVEKKTAPKKTTIVSRIKLSKNQSIQVNLKNSNGKKVSKVGKTASNVEIELNQSHKPKNLSFFKLIGEEPNPFKITVSNGAYGLCLHVITPYKRILPEFEIFVRLISAAPEKDKYSSLGVYNNSSASRIKLNVNPSSSLIVHVVPRINSKNMSWSQTMVHAGIDEPTTAKLISYQRQDTKNNASYLEFNIFNYPNSAKTIYAVRENIISGEILRLPPSTITPPDLMSPSKKEISYIDNSISHVNSTYRHDFFTVNKWGLESHIGNIVSRTFEKDTSGIKFRKASHREGRTRNVHIIDFSIYIPDIWIPNSGDDIKNPGDSIFEAAREKKKVGVLQLVRHSTKASSKIIGNFIISPDSSLSDIPISLSDERSLSGQFVVNKEFAKRFGIPPIDPELKYIYELRVGYYFLSNELSFLKNPIKLTVPNEFTNGKTGYSYHPYLYDSPLSKDFGIIPKLGDSKSHMKIESLTDQAQIFKFNQEQSDGNKTINLNCKLGSIKSNSNSPILYTIIESRIPRIVYASLDHVELLYADSSSGGWTSLGKNKISDLKFYYVDTRAPQLATNKIRYALIGRNSSMERIFSTVSADINLQPHNYIEKPKKKSSNITRDSNKNNKLS